MQLTKLCVIPYKIIIKILDYGIFTKQWVSQKEETKILGVCLNTSQV